MKNPPGCQGSRGNDSKQSSDKYRGCACEAFVTLGEF